MQEEANPAGGVSEPCVTINVMPVVTTPSEEVFNIEIYFHDWNLPVAETLHHYIDALAPSGIRIREIRAVFGMKL